MSHRIITRPLTRRQTLGALAAGAAAIGGLRLPSGAVGPSIASAQQTIEPVGQTGTTRAGTSIRYFPETGHNLKGPFLTRWQSAGGKDVLGAPLSEDRYAEGVGFVQTFETVTLVYDPALSAPWDVQAQHLPGDIRRDLAPASARRAVTSCKSGVNNCQFFPDKGHTISGRIREFWEANGDLPIFGYPTTEPFKEESTGLTLQVFERRRHVKATPGGKGEGAEGEGALGHGCCSKKWT